MVLNKTDLAKALQYNLERSKRKYSRKKDPKSFLCGRNPEFHIRCLAWLLGSYFHKKKRRFDK